MNAKKIDLDSWGRRGHYQIFNAMSMPCYGADVRVDVTKLVQRCRSRGESFFAGMLFIVTEALNGIEEFRMRNIGGEPYIFESVNPSFTVMTDRGYYVNRGVSRAPYAELCESVRAVIDGAKHDPRMNLGREKECLDVLYFSCSPWLDFSAVTQPIPHNTADSASIPRIVWGKYVSENGGWRMTLNITVNHAFVDGYPLSLAFGKIQNMLNVLEF